MRTKTWKTNLIRLLWCFTIRLKATRCFRRRWNRIKCSRPCSWLNYLCKVRIKVKARHRQLFLNSMVAHLKKLLKVRIFSKWWSWWLPKTMGSSSKTFSRIFKSISRTLTQCFRCSCSHCCLDRYSSKIHQ